jgi:hypothetical protein
MEERARNTVIKAKADKLRYADWLLKYVGEGDHEAEFGEKCFRRNEKWHARWDAYCENDVMTFEYTNKDTLEIDINTMEKKRDEDSALNSGPSFPMPIELKEWQSRGGNAVLRLSPCPAASLITLIRERLVLHRYVEIYIC